MSTNTAKLDAFEERFEELRLKMAGEWDRKLSGRDQSAQPVNLSTSMSVGDPVRTFESGATRSNELGRIDWIRMLSLPALFEYGRYMSRHRRQLDGSLRDFDNWKLGMPYSEVAESLMRHALDLAALADADTEPMRDCTPKETCCAIIFNAMAYLHFILKAEQESE